MADEPANSQLGFGAELIGTVLHDRYEVVKKLGVGGMATVYEGRRVGLPKKVAIKVLRAELAEDVHNVRRFLREAKAASVIVHENIVDIVDFGPVDDVPVYFVMEFLDGYDLRTLVKSSAPLPWSRCQPIALQTVAALAAAHEKGIVHRDVKPANVFLVPSRTGGPEFIKVLDFGIAKVTEEGRGITRAMTKTTGILGTVSYMAPEQAYGEGIDARTDIYAFGIVLYEMLTGSVPFRGRNPFTVLERHIKDAPAPIRTSQPQTPPEVEAIVLKCLAKAPRDRFQSMLELRAAISSINDGLDGEIIHRVHSSSAQSVASPLPSVHTAVSQQGSAPPVRAETEQLDDRPKTKGGTAPQMEWRAEPQTVKAPHQPILAGSPNLPADTHIPGFTIGPEPRAGTQLPLSPVRTTGGRRAPPRALLFGFGVGLFSALITVVLVVVLPWGTRDTGSSASPIPDPVPHRVTLPAQSLPAEASTSPPGRASATPTPDSPPAPGPDPTPNPTHPEAQDTDKPDREADLGASDTPEPPKAEPTPARRKRPRKPSRAGPARSRPETKQALPDLKTTTTPSPTRHKPWRHPDLKNPYGN